MSSAEQQLYDRRTIALHWATVALVLFLWGGAHAIDSFAKGPLRVDARSIHILAGMALLIIVGWRIMWRRTGGTIIARSDEPADRIAVLVHGLLYILLLATLVLGLLNSRLRGDSLFGLVRIPPPGGYSAGARHALSERVTGWHALSANAILLVASGHAVMGLVHKFGGRDEVLRRMLPGRDHCAPRTGGLKKVIFFNASGWWS